MEPKYAELTHVENDGVITPEGNHAFFHHLQQGLLLALRERGRLTERQYRYAAEALDRQWRDRAEDQSEEAER